MGVWGGGLVVVVVSVKVSVVVSVVVVGLVVGLVVGIEGEVNCGMGVGVEWVGLDRGS